MIAIRSLPYQGVEILMRNLGVVALGRNMILLSGRYVDKRISLNHHRVLNRNKCRVFVNYINLSCN